MIYSYPNQVSAINILVDLEIVVLAHYFGCKPAERNIDQHHNQDNNLMAEQHKDLSKSAIQLAVHNQVAADIVVAADNNAPELDIAAAVDNKKLAVFDKKLEVHKFVVENMPAVGDNNPVQYSSERQDLAFLLPVWFPNRIQLCRRDKDHFHN